MLELKLDGRTITEDEYLEHALNLQTPISSSTRLARHPSGNCYPGGGMATMKISLSPSHRLATPPYRLGTLAKAYVDAINSGAVPCLEQAVITLAQHENSAAMQKAANHYSEQMAQRVSFPITTL
ncbi:Guanylate-binding protein 6 [Myotis davidii]|uniref:Guanylate-binding protein 6 n=1 Tax=Myotis davidii TaxID=225400 RepID=L5M5W2_MYODS|nr:Guanylate-binding protein 6 [Myotis davidii]